MEYLRDIYQSLQQRVRSPVLFSILVAFVVSNWKALFALLYWETDVISRIAYFEDHTNLATLVVYPLFAGFFVAMLIPSLTLLGAVAVEEPVRKLRILQEETAHKVAMKTIDLKLELEKKQSELEQAIVDRAKLDRDVAQIENDQLRVELQNELAELRDQLEKVSSNGSIQSSVLSEPNDDNMLLGQIDAFSASVLNRIVSSDDPKITPLKRGSDVWAYQIESGYYFATDEEDWEHFVKVRDAISVLTNKRLLLPHAGSLRPSKEGYRFIELYHSQK